jgi:hypothetical protein
MNIRYSRIAYHQLNEAATMSWFEWRSHRMVIAYRATGEAYGRAVFCSGSPGGFAPPKDQRERRNLKPERRNVKAEREAAENNLCVLLPKDGGCGENALPQNRRPGSPIPATKTIRRRIKTA